MNNIAANTKYWHFGMNSKQATNLPPWLNICNPTNRHAQLQAVSFAHRGDSSQSVLQEKQQHLCDDLKHYSTTNIKYLELN